MPSTRVQIIAALGLFAATPSFADDMPPHDGSYKQGNEAAGKELAQNTCAICHALEPDALSPNEAAPNFHALTLSYPAEHLAEGFAEGILVGTDAHIGMPQFTLTPEQIDDLIAYLETVLPPPLVPVETDPAY